MEIPTTMFDWPEIQPPLKRYEWVILYLPHASNNPFIKMPLVYNTYLGAIASVDLTGMSCYQMHNGDVADNIFATFKVFMLVHKNYMRHVDAMVEISNAYYKYCFEEIDPNMSDDTAYCLCTSILHYL